LVYVFFFSAKFEKFFARDEEIPTLSLPFVLWFDKFGNVAVVEDGLLL